jgi:hypothetical protein
MKIYDGDEPVAIVEDAGPRALNTLKMLLQ